MTPSGNTPSNKSASESLESPQKPKRAAKTLFKRVLLLCLLTPLCIWGLVWGIDRLIPYLIDINGIRTNLEQEIPEKLFAKSGWSLSLGDIRVSPRWDGIHAVVQNIKLKGPKAPTRIGIKPSGSLEATGSPKIGEEGINQSPIIHKQNNASIKKLDVTIRYWPAIVGEKAEISSIIIDNLAVHLSKDPQLKEDLFTPKPNDPEPPAALKNSHIYLRGYLLSAGSWLDGTSHLQLKGKHLSVENLMADTAPHAQLDGLFSSNTESKTLLTQLASLNIKTRLPMLSGLTHSKTDKTTVPKPLSVNILLPQSLFANLKDIKLQPLSQLLRRHHIALRGQGNINQLDFTYTKRDKQKQNIPSEETLSLFVQSDNTTSLNYNGNSFKLDKGSIRLSSILKERQSLEKLLFSVDSTPLKIKASGDLKLKQPIDIEKINQQQLISQILNAPSNLKLETSSIPIASLRFVPSTTPLGRLLHTSSGTTQLDISSTGTVNNPNIKGYIALNDLRIPQEKDNPQAGLAGLTGTIHLDGTNAHLKQWKGKVNGTPFILTAHYQGINRPLSQGKLYQTSLTTESISLPLFHQSLLYFSNLFHSPLTTKLQALQAIDGSASVNTRINGSILAPKVKGALTLSHVNIYGAQSNTNQTIVPVIKDFNSTITFNQHNISLPSTRVTFDSIPLQVNGQFNTQTQELQASLKAKDIQVKNVYQRLLSIDSRLGIELPSNLQSIRQEFEDTITLSGIFDTDINVSGVISDPVISGKTNLSGFQLYHKIQQLQLDDINGTFDVQTNQIKLNKLSGLFNGMPFNINGQLPMPQSNAREYQFHLQSHDINLTEVKGELLKRFPFLGQELQTFSIEGIASIDITANGNLPKNIDNRPMPLPKFSGTTSVSGLAIHPDNLNKTIRLNPAELLFNKNGSLTLQPVSGHIGELAFNMDGKLEPFSKNGLPEYDFNFSTQDTSLRLIKQEHALFQKLVGLDFEEPSSAEGTFRLEGHLSNRETSGEIELNNGGITWNPNYPIKNLNGCIDLALSLNGEPSAKTHDLRFDIGSIRISNELSLQLNELPLNTTDQPETLKMKGYVTTEVHALDRLTEAPAIKTSGHLILENRRLLTKDMGIHLRDVGIIHLEGITERPLTPNERGFNARIYTEKPLNLAQLGTYYTEPFQSTGTINIDMGINGHNTDDLVAFGKINLDKVNISPLMISDVSGELSADGIQGLFNLSNIQLPGVKLKAQGNIPDIMTYPLPVSDVSIQGDLFVVAAWQNYVENVIEKKFINAFITPLFGEPDPTSPSVPFNFTGAALSMKEVIYDNVLINNVIGQMDISSSGFFQIHEAIAEVAGGTVDANISIDPKRNHFTTIHLEADHVKANAIARSLLNAPNQIFGDITGTIEITTSGTGETETIENVNGHSDFSIKNGRLPAIAKVETLLSAANVLRGGLLNLNLNNLLRTLSPFETNYFAELSGSANMVNGIAYTDDMLSDGKNLDLLIQGGIRLKDGYGDLEVFGTMSQNISGKLGKLGKLSPMSLIKFVPGLGFIPGVKGGGILTFVPGVGYVPGLGGRPKRFNRFKVLIQGPLEDEKSVKSFSWLPSSK